MDKKNRLLEKLNLPSRAFDKGDTPESDKGITEMMMDSRYIDQSSSLINQALQKGFDVLQMDDGQIVMTGTKTVVYRYHWDATQGKLVRNLIEDREEEERLKLGEVETTS